MLTTEIRDTKQTNKRKGRSSQNQTYHTESSLVLGHIHHSDCKRSPLDTILIQVIQFPIPISQSSICYPTINVLHPKTAGRTNNFRHNILHGYTVHQ
jgi:hypothetical protein